MHRLVRGARGTRCGVCIPGPYLLPPSSRWTKADTPVVAMGEAAGPLPPPCCLCAGPKLRHICIPTTPREETHSAVFRCARCCKDTARALTAACPSRRHAADGRCARLVRERVGRLCGLLQLPRAAGERDASETPPRHVPGTPRNLPDASRRFPTLPTPGTPDASRRFPTHFNASQRFFFFLLSLFSFRFRFVCLPCALLYESTRRKSG